MKLTVLAKLTFVWLFSITVQADVLNDYLSGKVFGAAPGPCPDKARQCATELDPDGLSTATQNIEICLINNYCFFGIGSFCFHPRVTMCQPIKDWIESGNVQLWDLTCEEVSLVDLAVISQQNSAQSVDVSFAAKEIALRCEGQLRLQDVFLFYKDGIAAMRIHLTGDTEITTDPGEHSSVSFVAKFFSDDFNQDPPDDIQIPQAVCNVFIGSGIHLDLLDSGGNGFELARVQIQVFGFDLIEVSINFLPLEGLTNIVVAAIEAAMGDIFCDVMSQGAKVDPDRPDTSADGDLNVLLDEFNDALFEAAQGKPDDVLHLDANPFNKTLFPDLTQAKVDASVDFADDSFTEIFSVMMNSWLGGTGDDGRLVINEAIEQLFGKDGDATVDLEANDVILEGTLPLALTDLTARVKQIHFIALNNVELFQLMANNFEDGSSVEDRLHYTLNHTLKMSHIEIEIKLHVTMKRGGWVTETEQCGDINICRPDSPDGIHPHEGHPDQCTCQDDQEDFDFSMIARLDDFFIDASSFTLVQPSLLDNVQVGQLFGQRFSDDAVAGIQRISACLAPAFHAAYFPSLSFSIGNIITPSVEIPDNAGIAQLVEGVVLAFDRLYNSVLRDDAPGLTQGELRPILNDHLREDLVEPADLKDCPSYTPGQLDEEELYMLFDEGLINQLYPVVNQVLGDFSTDSGTSMNDVVQVMMEYFSTTYEDFPLESAGVDGSWKLKPDDVIMGTIPGFQDSEANPSRIVFSDFTMKNLDTIYSLFTGYFGKTHNGFESEFAFGFKMPENQQAPLELAFKTEFHVQDAETEHGSGVDAPVETTITFKLLLDQMNASFAMDNILLSRDRIYRLYFKQLDYTPCLLSTVENVITVVASSLQAGDVFFDFEIDSETAQDPPIVDAFQALDAALAQGSSAQFKAMTNTILDNGFEKALISLANFNASITPENCLDADDPLGNLFALFTGFDLPAFTERISYCIDDLHEQPLTPEEAEKEVKIPPDATFFDFTDSFIVEQFQNELGTNEDDENRNALLKEIVFLLANESGTPLSDSFFLEKIEVDGELVDSVTFSLPTAENNWLFDLMGMDPLVYEDDSLVPGFHIQITNVTIKGVDRFTSNTKFLEVKSRFVTAHSIGFSEDEPLDVFVNGYLETDNSFIGSTEPGKVREDFEIFTQLKGFDLSFDLLVAIDTGVFGNLTLGHFFKVTSPDQDFVSTDYAVDCVFFTFFEDGISLPNLNISISHLSGPTLTTTQRFFSAEVADVLDESLKLVTQMYIEALPNAAFNCFREDANDNLQNQWLESQQSGCPANPDHIGELPAEDEYLRFGTSVGVQRFQSFMSDNLYADNYELWNQVMEVMTTDENGNALLLFDEDFLGFENLPMTYHDVNYGHLTMNIMDMRVYNLSTFTKVNILEPVANDNFSAYTAFKITGKLLFDFKHQILADDIFVDYDVLQNDLRMEVYLDDVDFGLTLHMLLNVTEALSIRFSSVSSFNELPCLLTPFDALEPSDFNLSFADVRLVMRCDGKCEFPVLEEIFQFGGVIDTATDEDVEIADSLDEALQFIIDYIESSGFQKIIDDQLEHADENCAEALGFVTSLTDFASSEDVDAAAVMAYAFLGFFGAACVVGLTLFPTHRKRKMVMMAEFAIAKKTMEPEKEMGLFLLSIKALFYHPAIPVFVRFVVPVMCLIHVAGLLVAIGFSGAMNVVLIFTILGAETNQIVLVPFTIISTINDIWNSGSWYLGLLLFLASCAWPIIKNLLLMAIWFMPTTLLSHRRRDYYLFVLDLLGKWSLLDVFVVVMTLAALRTYLELSEYSKLSLLPPDSYNVDVNVTPERGVILLMVIASSSLVMNHVISYYHVKAEEYDQKKEDEARGVLAEPPKRATMMKPVDGHAFAGFDKNGRKRTVSSKALKVLTATNVISGLFLFIGLFVPLVTFEMGGLIGLFIETLDPAQTKKTYSVFDLAILVNQSPAKTGLEILAVTFFQILLITCSTIIPVILTIMNVIILYKKFSLPNLKFTLWIHYLLTFWSANEAFLIAVILTLAEMERITVYIVDFISDDMCSNIQGALEVAFGPQNGKCLDVTGKMEPTAALMFIGVIFQIGCAIYVINICEAVVADRYFQAYNGARKNVKPPKSSRIRRHVLRKLTDKKKVGKRKIQLDEEEEAAEEEAVMNFNSVASPNEVEGEGSLHELDEDGQRTAAAYNPLFRASGTTPPPEEIIYQEKEEEAQPKKEEKIESAFSI